MQASNTVKAAALLMAAPALLLPMKAAAQQMGLGGPRTVAECETLSTYGAKAECIVRLGGQENRKAAAEAGARADAASARADASSARADASDRENSCGNDIKSGIGSGTFKVDRLKEVLAGRPAKDVGLCKILDQLKS